jgi:hypothetical protein
MSFCRCAAVSGKNRSSGEVQYLENGFSIDNNIVRDAGPMSSAEVEALAQ